MGQVRASRTTDGSKCRIYALRTLKSPSSVLARSSFAFLTNLRTLSVDFDDQGLVTQNHVLLRIFHNLDQIRQLTTLSLTSLPRIDIGLLRLLARTFPALTNLVLSSTERLDCSCCAHCLLDSASCMIHSPIPDMFAEVSGLAVNNQLLHSM